MPRFFASSIDTDNKIALIEGEDSRHIARSLRMAVGEEITVSDGGGTEHNCRLTLIRDELCECEILSSECSKNEPSYRITLYMAYPKGDKMELIIQKAVELGAARIVPFESSRCIKRPDKDKLKKLSERHNRIAKEAAGQSERGRLPTVSEVKSFNEIKKEIKECELALLCYENERGLSIKDALKERQSFGEIALIVGAEGGFSKDEAEELVSLGAYSVSLGRRILRCETAPIFALSAISCICEL